MRKVFIPIYLASFMWLLLLSCKNSNGNTANINNDYNEEDYHTLFDPQRYMLPVAEGVYVPKGLKKMTMLEQMKFWKDGGVIEKLPFKNYKGDPIPFDSISLSNLKIITQMYMNDSGRIQEAIAFEVTPQFAAQIRAGYTPENTSNENLNLKDRFLIPTPPGAYAPRGLRKLSLLEMMKYGEEGKITGSYIQRNDKGEMVKEDYYTSGPGNRYMQIFVDENEVIKEAVIYDMTEQINCLFTLLRFSKVD